MYENSSGLQDVRVLYVENEEKTKDDIYFLLRELHAQTDVASNLQEVFKVYKESTYDIVIVNLVSVTNGFDIIKEIRFLHKDQSLIVIVDEDDARQLKNSIKMGINGYIFLPFIRQNIINTLFEVCKHNKIQEQLEKNDAELNRIIEEKSKQFLYDSYHDKLTDLCNHFALSDLLAKAPHAYVVLLNIDHFRNINDAYGFELGDNVLREAARLLKMVVPSHAKLFRLNSDEFVIVIEEQISKEKLTELLDSIEYFFNESEIALEEGIEVRISFSIGISLGQGVKLLHEAKIALLELREHNRGGYKFFDTDSTYLLKQKIIFTGSIKSKNRFRKGNFSPIFSRFSTIRQIKSTSTSVWCASKTTTTSLPPSALWKRRG
jgi:diguanylate cyclase (GGDEF) domain